MPGSTTMTTITTTRPQLRTEIYTPVTAEEKNGLPRLVISRVRCDLRHFCSLVPASWDSRPQGLAFQD